MSVEIKATSGPWRAEADKFPYIGTKDGNVWWRVWGVKEGELVAEIARTDNPTAADIAEEAANAHLTAAAWDLLNAADAMMQAIVVRLGDRTLHCDHDWPIELTQALGEELDALRFAIYKAQGKYTNIVPFASAESGKNDAA